MLIYGGTRLIESFVCVLNTVKILRVCSKDWRKSSVVPLFKGGDLELVGNYRGIALGSCVARGCFE